jgi:hypothetical protein
VLRQVFATILVHGSQSFFQSSPSPPLESEMFDPAFLRPAVLALRTLIAFLVGGLTAGRAAVHLPVVTPSVYLEVPATPGALEEVVFQLPSAARETGLIGADVPCCTWLCAAG